MKAGPSLERSSSFLTDRLEGPTSWKLISEGASPPWERVRSFIRNPGPGTCQSLGQHFRKHPGVTWVLKKRVVPTQRYHRQQAEPGKQDATIWKHAFSADHRIKTFKDHFCGNYLSYRPVEPIKLRKEKDRRPHSEQTITLLEIYSATIITQKKNTTEGNSGPWVQMAAFCWWLRVKWHHVP